MKGIAAAAIEALEAARAAGVEDRVRADIAGRARRAAARAAALRLPRHAARRVDEMRAAAAYVEELGVEPRIASAAAEWLAQLRDWCGRLTPVRAADDSRGAVRNRA